MPIKNATKRPQHVIDEAVKRYMAGEQASTLAKYYKVSKPGLYLWIQKYKRELLEKSGKRDISPEDAELTEKRVLIAELQALKLENKKLRDRVVDMMVKYE